MKGLFFALSFFVFISLPQHTVAQIAQPEVEYQVGTIQSMTPTVGAESSSIDVRIRITRGSDVGRDVSAQYVFDTEEERGRFEAGDRVVVYRTVSTDERIYFIAEEYRIPQLVWFFVLFAIMVIAATRLRGVFAFVGLVFSAIVIVQFLLPQILAGKNPFIISAVAAIAILYISVFTAHGVRPRTVIAAIGMTGTIIFAIGASYLVVVLAQLTGLGSEEAFMVQFGLERAINAQGLLLGGMIIGVLGVLDDVATAQVAAVEELYRANHRLTFRELFTRGFSVGKEHIISLVNTLVLAYAGASLPVFLLLTVTDQPWWVSLNSEPFAEEIVRALVGSMALVVAVPLTTVCAAALYSRRWFREMIADE